MAQHRGQELNCPELLFQGAAETQQSRPLRANGNCQRFVGGPYTATGVQEVAQVTGFSRRRGLRGHHVTAAQHTRLDCSCSADGIFVPPLTEETRGLHSSLNFKIQEWLNSVFGFLQIPLTKVSLTVMRLRLCSL